MAAVAAWSACPNIEIFRTLLGVDSRRALAGFHSRDVGSARRENRVSEQQV